MAQFLWQAMDQEATLVTANARLARNYRIEFDSRQQASGKGVWPTAEIFSWPVWIDRLHQAGFPPEVVMNEHQQAALWQQAIAEDGVELLDVAAAAKAAARAWRLVETWNVPMDDPSFEHHADGKAFRRWARRFELAAKDRGWFTTARQEQAVAAGLAPAPKHLLLAGFDELTPLQTSVIEKCRQLGSNVEMVEPNQIPAEERWVASFEDRPSEIGAAATWARRTLDARPSTSVAIIATGLAQSRAELDRALEQALGVRAFNISLGIPLTQWPMASAALLVLQLATSGTLSMEEWGALLRCPFVFGAERELAARGMLEARLRRKQTMKLKSTEIHQDCPLLNKLLGDLEIERRSLPKKQSMAAWTQCFSMLLQTAGWPGERVLSSSERQTLARWNEAVSALSSLESVEPIEEASKALSWLRRIVNETIFQPETANAPVQVLEGLQAAGSQFDAVWILGMEDRSWPAPARPEPFLPRELQLRLDLPHSTAEREYRFAHDMFNRLLCSAPLVIASYPGTEGEEELRPSGFLAGFEKFQEDENRADYWLTQRKCVELEVFEDSKAPELLPGVLSGGSYLLKNTAQCPFRGFATVRLGAGALESPQPGLAPKQRGALLHTAMECFWREVQSHGALVAQQPNERTSTIKAACAEAVAKHREAWMTDRFTELEESRLEKLLSEWLEVEVKRENFELAGTEQSFEIELDGVKIKLRIDRIDRLKDGREAIIDYKSTAPASNSWEGARMEEPQLPLYAIQRAATVDAVMFAQMKAGETKFRGAAARNEIAPSVKMAAVPWADQIDAWRTQLTGFAHELRTGYAPVAPSENACKYCELPALCRINAEGGGAELIDE